MGRLIWSPEAWEDYLWWERQDRKTLKRINRLILDVQRFGAGDGIGKPERLRGDASNLWSRRIDEANRLVYLSIGDDVEIIACKTHHGDIELRAELKRSGPKSTTPGPISCTPQTDGPLRSQRRRPQVDGPLRAHG